MTPKEQTSPAIGTTSRTIADAFTPEEKLQLVLDMTNAEGFDKWFEIIYQKFQISQEKAFYLICELFHMVAGRDPMYKNFDSYRRARAYRINDELKSKLKS